MVQMKGLDLFPEGGWRALERAGGECCSESRPVDTLPQAPYVTLGKSLPCLSICKMQVTEIPPTMDFL